MKIQRSLFTAGLLTALAFTVTAYAQEKKAMPSPPATASVQLGNANVKIDYSAPSMRGRKIMGGLVPYDKWWRTGANAATTLTTSADLDINGASVPAGTYTLFTLPSEGTWKLIVSKATGEWGTDYDPSKDLVRVDMEKATATSPQEVMSISFDKTSGSSTQMHVRWDKTDVWVPMKAK